MTDQNTTLADELERLSIAAEKTADDIRYYSGGSKHNKEAEALAELCSTNLPTILAALRSTQAQAMAPEDIIEAIQRMLERGRATLDKDGYLVAIPQAQGQAVYGALADALRMALEWIDAVPSGTILPAMPGFDRDWVDGLLSGRDPQQQTASQAQGDVVERAVIVCPQCDGEGSYADGLDEAACSTDCTRCGSNGWIVDRAALAAMQQQAPVAEDVRELVAKHAARFARCAEMLEQSFNIPGTLRIEYVMKAKAFELEARDALERLSTQPQPDAAGAVEPTLPPDLAKWVLDVGKVEWGATDPHDADGHADHIRTSVNLTAEHFQQAEPQQMHGLYIEGTGTVICHTGTSPNSPRTAQLLTGAWNWFHDAAIRAGGQP